MWRTRLEAIADASGVLLLLFVLAAVVRGEEATGLSFYPPFKTFNARGDRTVPSYTLLGGTTVKQSFARLTPDRLSNTGSMYSRLTARLSTGPPGGQFSLAMTFRVSGDSDKYHGKYLALVVGIPETIRKQGPTLGFPENFVGVGVVISSRPPSDMSEPSIDEGRTSGPRQFVSIFANNGTRSTEEVRVLANSCASTVRYAQGRDDFHFLKNSRVRLGFYDGEVSLEVDSRSIGIWRKCVTTKVEDMPERWLDRAGVALSAETGREVSNNHDVMGVEVYTERSDAFDKRIVDGASADEEGSAEAEAGQRTIRIASIQAHMEHEFDAVERAVKDSLSRLAYMNDEMYRRLEAAEKTLNKDAMAFLSARVKGIEERVKMNALPALESRLKGVERDVHDDMGSTMDDMLGKSMGWRLPFFLVLVILGGLVGVAFQQYRKLIRSNYIGSYR